MEKYGVENYSQSPIIKQKSNETMRKNGTVPTSSQQIKIFNILLNYFKDVYINYVFDWAILDIVIFINNLKIDIEYDGWYWHDKNKDYKRDKYLLHRDWKILRIKSATKLPSEIELLDNILKLINTEETFTQIILDDWKDKDKIYQNEVIV
jgi:very-short-patch-repair endonuclease